MVRVVPLSLLLLVAWVSVAFSDTVSEVGSSRLSFFINGNELRIPYYRNKPLTGSYPQVTRAVVLVHGDSRNAGNALDNMVAAAVVAGVADSTTILIAPQFLTEDDISAHGLAANMLFWSEPGWKDGAQSLSTAAHPRPATVSDFAIMDSILFRIADRNPNLQSVVVAGHSAGGQFVNRYAVGNAIDQVLHSQFNVTVAYVTANPSSYLYFNGERVVPGTTTTFATPSPQSIQSCSGYNTYKYGLVQLNPYMSALTPAQLGAQYSSRRVTYLLGGLDANPNDPSMDTSCSAEFQGEHRLMRGQIYRNYLSHFFGPAVLATHHVEIIPGVGHNSTDMFTSACGAAALFGTSCNSLGVGEAPHAQLPGVSLSVPNPIKVPATIRFRVPRDGGRATLRVHDIHGRTVRTLVDGAAPAESGEVLWDGRSDAGTKVVPGAYFFRLQQGSTTVATKRAVLQ